MRRTLVEYLDHRLGTHSGNGPEFKWHCPACIDRVGSESSSPKLNLNTARGIGHCYRCEYAFRDLHSLFRMINGGIVTLEELRIIRREITPVSNKAVESVGAVLSKTVRTRDLKPVPLPSGIIDLCAEKIPPMAFPATRYLSQRGVGRDLIAKHQIGYASSGRYAGYLTFPVLQDGEQIYFTTRFAGKAPDNRKSNNPIKADGFHAKSTCLLNYDGCKGKKKVAIVEGPFDMMAWPNAVALMGKVISDRQIGLIDRLVAEGTRHIVISLDADAGKHAQVIRARLIGRVPKLTLLMLADGDPFDHRADIADLARDTTDPSSAMLVLSRYRNGSLIKRGKLSRYARSSR